MPADFDYYKTFYYVARTGNITLAAKALHLTQPTVTKAIRNLERQLDGALFIRTPKGVELTPDGEAMYRKVKPAYEMILEAENEMQARHSLQTGQLRIGTGTSIGSAFIIRCLAVFRERYPNIEVKFISIPKGSAVESVERGNIGIAVDTAFTPGAPIGSGQRVVGHYNDLACVGKKYAFLADRPTVLEILSRYPIIMPKHGSLLRSFYDELFRLHGLRLEPILEIDGVDTLVELAKSGLGICFLPDINADEGIENGSLFRLLIPDVLMSGSINLTYPRNRPLTDPEKAFIDLL